MKIYAALYPTATHECRRRTPSPKGEQKRFKQLLLLIDVHLPRSFPG